MVVTSEKWEFAGQPVSSAQLVVCASELLFSKLGFTQRSTWLRDSGPTFVSYSAILPNRSMSLHASRLRPVASQRRMDSGARLSSERIRPVDLHLRHTLGVLS